MTRVGVGGEGKKGISVVKLGGSARYVLQAEKLWLEAKASSNLMRGPREQQIKTSLAVSRSLPIVAFGEQVTSPSKATLGVEKS